MALLKRYGGKRVKGSKKADVRRSILANSSAAQLKTVLEKSGRAVPTPAGGKVPTSAITAEVRRTMLRELWGMAA